MDDTHSTLSYTDVISIQAAAAAAVATPQAGGAGYMEEEEDGVTTQVEKKRVRRSRSLADKVFVESGALQTSLVNFLLAYNLRAGVSVLIRILTLLRKADFKRLFTLSEVVSEKHLHFQEEAVRMGLFLGGFTGVYRAVTALLGVLNSSRIHSPKNATEQEPVNNSGQWWHSFAAGTLAGSCLIFMDSSWHRTLALYIATRAAQCLYNFSKSRGYFHFWGSSWDHGDSLLFALSSAQIMYAYVMRPETLPPSYYRFIRTQGPLEEVVLQAVRDNNRGLPVNTGELLEFVKKTGGEDAMAAVMPYFTGSTSDSINQFPRLIPCRALHPYTRFCSWHTLRAFWGVARQIFPVYFSLAFVPSVVLRFRSFSKSPLEVLTKCTYSAIRSTAFLSIFCSGYQAVICVQREVLEHFGWGDNKISYYVAGLISSLSILIERKSRRSELALYALPRAADSVFLILNQRKILFPIPQGEILLFMISTGFCMFFFEHDQKSMNPLVVKILERFLPNQETLDAMRRSQSYGIFDSRTNSTTGRAQPGAVMVEDANGNEPSANNMPGNGESQMSLSGSTLIP